MRRIVSPAGTMLLAAALGGPGTGLAPALVAQEAPVRVGIVPFEFTGDPVRPELRDGLALRLAESLGRARAVRIEAEAFSPDRLDAAGAGAPTPAGGRFSEEVLARLADGEAFDHYLLGRVENRGGELVADLSLLSRDGRALLDVRVVDLASERNPLVDEVTDRLALQLGKNIRIAILRFPLMGGDTARYGRLERGLPSMLTTELGLSSRLVLLESFDRDVLLRGVEASRRNAGIQDRLTALEIGRQLQANYYIMGEFWELDGALRVDTRCVSIESGEIVMVRGITVDPVDLSTLEDRMVRLAAEFRSAIESDFLRQESRPRYVAVTGFPPYPHTPENRALLAELVRTTGRKLKVVESGGIRVREDPVLLADFLDRRQDRWAMSSALEADVLVTLALDGSDPERLVIDYDIYDTRDPENLASFTSPAGRDGLDTVLDDVVARLFAFRGEALAPEDRERIRELRVGALHDRWSWRIRGGAAGRLDNALFLDSGGGLVLDGGPLWIPDRKGHWHVEPMNLRLDLLASKAGGDRVVFGADLMLVGGAYRFRPHRVYNPYVGGSFGVLGVVRKGVGDVGYNARPGAGLLVGVEQTLGSLRKLTYEVELTVGFSRVPAQVIGDQPFSAGRPGGLYVTFGTVF